MKAALVLRASTDVQEMDSQRAALLSYAEGEGYTVPSEYIHEEHYTGMDGFDKKTGEYLDVDFVRPTIAKLQSQIEKDDELKLVIIYELTRLSRNPFTVTRLVNWFNARQVTLYIYDVEWSTRKYSPLQKKWIVDDAVIENIFAAANYGVAEWKKIRKRTKRGRDYKAQKGLYVGHLSDGYKVVIGTDGEKHIAIDEERAMVIKDIFNYYTEEGLSTDKIAAKLNAQGVLTFNALEAQKNVNNKSFKQTYTTHYTKQERRKSDVLWAGGNVGQLLKNRWYIGERTYNGVVYHVPEIISMEQFMKAQGLLIHNKKNTPKRRENVYPLRGLLKCGTCGSPLYGHRVRISSTYYCSSLETGTKCGQEGINKQNIDGIVWQTIIDTFCYEVNTEFPASRMLEVEKNQIYDFLGISNADRDNIASEIESIKDELDRIDKDIELTKKLFIGYNRDIKLPENKDFVKEIQKELNQCRASLNKLTLDKERLTGRLHSQEQLLTLAEDNSVESIANKIRERIKYIETTHNLNELEDVFKRVINSVTLYQSTHYTKVIDIETLNHSHIYALYNARRKRGYYISCPVASMEWKFAPSKNAFISPRDIYLYEFYTESGTVLTFRNNQMPPYTIQLIQEDICTDYKVQIFHGEISVEELFVTLCRSDYLKPISHVEEEPSDEQYQEWKKQQKEWYLLRESRRKEKYKNAREEKEKELKKLAEGYYKISDMVAISKLSYSTIWREIVRQVLPAIRKYDTYLVQKEDFDKYLQTKQK